MSPSQSTPGVAVYRTGHLYSSSRDHATSPRLETTDRSRRTPKLILGSDRNASLDDCLAAPQILKGCHLTVDRATTHEPHSSLGCEIDRVTVRLRSPRFDHGYPAGGSTSGPRSRTQGGNRALDRHVDDVDNKASRLSSLAEAPWGTFGVVWSDQFRAPERRDGLRPALAAGWRAVAVLLTARPRRRGVHGQRDQDAANPGFHACSRHADDPPGAEAPGKPAIAPYGKVGLDCSVSSAPELAPGFSVPERQCWRVVRQRRAFFHCQEPAAGRTLRQPKGRKWLVWPARSTRQSLRRSDTLGGRRQDTPVTQERGGSLMVSSQDRFTISPQNRGGGVSCASEGAIRDGAACQNDRLTTDRLHCDPGGRGHRRAGLPAAATDAVTVQSNLCYEPNHGACVDGASHELDAYLPSGVTQKTPGAIVIHGGGFTSGDKSGMNVVSTELAQNGIAAFSINYRLDNASVVGFPIEYQDVLAAIAYIRKHHQTFNVDPKRIGSFGTSAGATLAVYSAMKAQQDDPAAQVIADVGWSGGYDLTGNGSSAIDPGQLHNIEWYVGCSDPGSASCAPTQAAASATTLVQPGDPATLLANSTDYKVGCEIVPPSQAEEMDSDLASVHVPVQLDLNDLCAHALAYASYEMPSTMQFLEAHLFVAPTITSRSSKAFRIGTSTAFPVKSKGDPTPFPDPMPAGCRRGSPSSTRATAPPTSVGHPRPAPKATYPLTITASNGGHPDAVQHFTLNVDVPRR